MADPLLDVFTQEVVTERELKKLRPEWPSVLIRDYLSVKRTVFVISESVGASDDRLAAIELRLESLEVRATYLEGTIVVTAIDVTAEGNTTIICTDALTVSLSTTPLDKDLVKVKARNGNVTINGNGKNIDGDSSVIIRRNFTGLDMVYSSVLGGWSIV